MKKTVIVASLLALAGISTAAAADDSWYVRGDLGSARISVSGLGHDDAFGGALRLGYFFNPNFAIEGGYVDFGDHHSVKVDAWGLGLVGKANLGQGQTGWFIDGRLGVNRLHASVSGISGNTTKPYVGAGVGYDFSQSFGMSLNYLYNKGDSGTSAQLFSVGFEGRF